MNPERTRWIYRISLTLFCVLFIGSAILTVVDAKGSYEGFARLQFPAWILYPLSLAKVLGVIVILKSSCRTLKDFAYAGFLYDLLLALGGHIANWWDQDIFLALFGLVLWNATFWLDRLISSQKI
jgi:hypothetical protein